MNNLHLLRPWCLLLLIPLLLLITLYWRRKPGSQVWNNICDAHLLPHILYQNKRNQRFGALIWLTLAISLLDIGLSGPSWTKFPVPSFQQIQPHVIVLDMSAEMTEQDISPSRIERAKFIIHDILKRKDAGQFSLIAYTSEPFVVSPLTEDGNTIDALLSSLTTEIMPIRGHKLAPALEEAEKLIKQAGYTQGNILVLTAHPPETDALDEAAVLAAHNIPTSVMPIIQNTDRKQWQSLASEGKGLLLSYTNPNKSINQWLGLNAGNPFYDQKALDDIPIWKDEGRWFILAGTLMLLIVFRRGWLQRIET
tara:strand:- start:39 stop:965 length:927 start_codon:yes stop_codon:yes gene_type:complete